MALGEMQVTQEQLVIPERAGLVVPEVQVILVTAVTRVIMVLVELVELLVILGIPVTVVLMDPAVAEDQLATRGTMVILAVNLVAAVAAVVVEAVLNILPK